MRMRQILDPAGELVGPAPDLDDSRLVEMFRLLLTTRMADEKLLNLQRQGRMPAYYQVSGQEAHVGAALALRESDWLFTAYRELGMWLARGMSPLATVGLWMGVPDDDDLWDVNRYRVTRLNATIGTHLPHAVGFGYAERLQGRDTVAMVVFGDGATSESDFHAAMNFAGVWKTPTVFLCQNNQVAQSTTIDKQTAAATLASKADGYGFCGERVDGMDPLAMYQAAREAVDRAASGRGADPHRDAHLPVRPPLDVRRHAGVPHHRRGVPVARTGPHRPDAGLPGEQGPVGDRAGGRHEGRDLGRPGGVRRPARGPAPGVAPLLAPAAVRPGRLPP